MRSRRRKLHPALKHAGYSAMGLLPGERRADFEKLHADLIAEFAPAGAYEDDIVADMAALIWRKQHLESFRIAKVANRRFEAKGCEVMSRERGADQRLVRRPEFGRAETPAFNDRDPEVVKAALAEARKDLGWMFEFIQIGDVATTDQMMKEIEIRERLDAMIDKCIKRLFLAHGVKSISPTSHAAQPTLIPAPPNAGEGMFDSARSTASQARRSRPDVRPQRLSAPTNVPGAPLVIATDDAKQHDH
jgi:hypothetical protein